MAQYMCHHSFVPNSQQCHAWEMQAWHLIGKGRGQAPGLATLGSLPRFVHVFSRCRAQARVSMTVKKEFQALCDLLLRGSRSSQ